jgi:hypothetical protein
MYVLIETQWWEENKESFFYKLLGRQERLDLQDFIHHWYSTSYIQRWEDQKQHIKEHLPNLIKHFQKYYPDNHVEYISELIKKLS